MHLCVEKFILQKEFLKLRLLLWKFYTIFPEVIAIFVQACSCETEFPECKSSVLFVFGSQAPIEKLTHSRYSIDLPYK